MTKSLEEAKYEMGVAAQILLNAQSAKESLALASLYADASWRYAVKYFNQTKAEYKALKVV